MVRYRFKFQLPRIHEATLDGIRLDLSQLSPRVRNRILMGIYEVHERELCEQFLTSEDSVLEIGGAIGFIGLICQKKIGIRQYCIVEANPKTLDALRSNYRLNDLTPKAWNLALGPADGIVQLNVTSDFWDNSILTNGERGPGGETMDVPATSLSGLLQRVGTQVNVLIIDIEGAEQFIDPGDIPPEIDKIIIELHPKLLGATATYDFIAALIREGFFVAREEAATFAFLRRPRPAETGPLQRRRREPELALER